MRALRNDVRPAADRGRAATSACPRRTRRAGATVALIVAASVAATIVFGLPPLAVVAIGLTALVAVAAISHRVVGSLLAGLTLSLARPYNPGEHVRLYAPELDAVVVAEIVRLGLVHSTLATPSGLLVVPNSLLLRSTPPDAG